MAHDYIFHLGKFYNQMSYDIVMTSQLKITSLK